MAVSPWPFGQERVSRSPLQKHDRIRILLMTGIALFFALPSPDLASASPITFMTALPVGADFFVLDEQFLSMPSAMDPTPADRFLGVSAEVSTLAYGVTRDFTLFAMVPYLWANVDMSMPNGVRQSQFMGAFGDVSVFGRYTAYEHDATGSTFRIAPIVGFVAPAGGLVVPAGFEPGSWALEAGGIVTYQTLDYELDGSLTNIAPTGGAGFPSGITELDGNFQYRIWPFSIGEGLPDYLYAGLETNILYQGNDDLNGMLYPEGTLWFLDPTLQFVTEYWLLEAGVQIPVFQNLTSYHGFQGLQNDYILHLGVRFNFSL